MFVISIMLIVSRWSLGWLSTLVQVLPTWISSQSVCHPDGLYFVLYMLIMWLNPVDSQ